jgi:hypothetical protein
MSTSPYLVAAYLGSAALYGGYLAHLLRRRRVLAGALADREARLAGRDAPVSAREAMRDASRGAPDASRGAR